MDCKLSFPVTDQQEICGEQKAAVAINPCLFVSYVQLTIDENNEKKREEEIKGRQAQLCGRRIH